MVDFALYTTMLGQNALLFKLYLEVSFALLGLCWLMERSMEGGCYAESHSLKGQKCVALNRYSLSETGPIVPPSMKSALIKSCIRSCLP